MKHITILQLMAFFFGASLMRIALGFVPSGSENESIKDTKKVLEYRNKINDELIGLLEKDTLEEAEETRSKDLEKELKRVDAELEKREKIAEKRRQQRDLEERGSKIVTPRYTGLQDRLSSNERRDVRRFSIARVLSAKFEGRELDGVEAEMASEGRNELTGAGISVRGNAINIPSFAVLRSEEERAMTATGGTGLNQGGMTIETNKAPLLDDLFERMVLTQMGMTSYTGLQGNLDLPRFVKGSDPAHKAENAAADDSSPTTAQLSLVPRRLPVRSDISRQLFLQSQERNLDTAVRRHIVGQLSEIIQRKLINGAGSGSNEPEGILNTTGIGSVPLGTNGAAPTWADIVKLETEVSAENADIGNLFYLGNSAVRGKLKGTAKFSSTDSMTILDDRSGGLLNGYENRWTNGVPSNLTKGSGTALSALIFGNFVDLVMAQWSGIEFILDEFTQASTGTVRLHAAIYYDGGVQRPESFAAINDMVTA